MLLKQGTVCDDAVHHPAHGQPVDPAAAVHEARQVGLVDCARFLCGGKIHQLILKPCGIIQRKSSAGDNIRQRTVFTQELVKIQIIVAYNKLDLHIGQLGLDILRIGAVQLRAPQIDRNWFRFLPVLYFAA